MFLPLPEYVTKIIEKLQKNGYRAYAVGGCVRDLLMNKTPHDYDVATNALPETVQNLFEHTVPTGIQHGTVTVIADTPIEVTTFRTENGYADSRRPDSVCFVDGIEADLARRDFTVNAIAYCQSEGIVDLFGGQQDINCKILRAVGEPKLRFKEDALRILRLFRFASQLGFTPEECTLNRALELSDTLEKISRERIAAELTKAVCGSFPDALTPLLKCGALEFLGIKYNSSLKLFAKLKKRENIRLAAFINICGGFSEQISKELKLSNKLRDYLKAMEYLLSLDFKPTRVFLKQALRKTNTQAVYDYLELRFTLFGDDISVAYDMLNSIIQNNEPFAVSHLAISGEDIISLGITGKQVSNTLNMLLEKVISDASLNTKERLLDIINN